MKITGQVEYTDYLKGFLLHYKSNISTMIFFMGYCFSVALEVSVVCFYPLSRVIQSNMH